MKKIQTIACVITMLMTWVVSPASAASGTDYEVKVGETLRLDISNYGVQCMSNGSSYTWDITPAYIGDDTNYDEYLTFTTKSKNYAIVKGVKAGKLVGIQYTGYYYYNGTRKEFNDVFYARIENAGTPKTGPSTLEVSPAPLTLKVGETESVYAKQTKAIGGTYFYSEDTSIATVTSGELESEYSYTTTAKITGIKPGKVNIIAKNVNGLTAICEVTVATPPVTSVSILSSLTLEIGDTYDLIPTISPYNAETSFTWISDNSDVATVSNLGRITAENEGVANIKVTTNNGKTATCMVTVNPPQPIEHEIQCHIHENGKVLYNGNAFTGYNYIHVAEGCDASLTIVPDDGYEISWLWIDYEDAKEQLINNVLVFENVMKDISVTVAFEKAEQPVVHTENILTLDNVVAYTGTTVSFPISLTNHDEITALQMDLYLPEGISLVNDEEGDVAIEMSDRVSKNHTTSGNMMPNGSYRIICYSTKNNAFSGDSGELFNVMLNVATDMKDGEYEIFATNIELSDNTGTAYTGQDVKGSITVKSYMVGDTDNNGKHTINDAVCIINYILNQPSAAFLEAAADIDGNGKITINDAVLLISKYILGETAKACKATRTASTSEGTNLMSIEDITMQPGEVIDIEMNMDNDCLDIKGLQCDITLPRGFSFLYDEDAENYVSATSRVPSEMALISQLQENSNTLRVAGASTGNTAIFGNSGSVFSFKVKADESIKEGVYEIQLNNVELSHGEAINIPDRSSALKILYITSATFSTDGNLNKESYDLYGRRNDTSQTRRGIYIVNGKKMYFK